ncbi:polysaccharide biosynthesis tyrosine autokinase [Cocleimonas sp. KMM 6892]|uniref:polysaccharide biosynthesis tyrosine autokinase n=1 Tax=unclassified Cocleimonas TaxID=2639732 RepID=UPI002DB7A9E6|nr:MULTISPECIES: polysaccharide biosynthesis tyrosine autokinase [unclassified Cocleimonas]MEB8430950.1 polysaccharide biosynthesis tyrosine autokinase [Cocleimonas sp. KMM 6892]MEC4714278.1 polysaccharide biosynthesis tyrosine autokinase [Cocleimonas sp. KMM 6895]MEC4743609.1 polysaccharide biosynthesis tyrosine autokinase [Cocleimonas sp. KMM 6896]
MTTTNQQHTEDDEIDLRELLATLLDGKWLILSLMISSLLLAIIFAFGKTPIYRADSLLQIEAEKAGIPGIEELAGLGGVSASAGTELQILKSRKIIGKAVSDLKLDIIATPKKIPFFSNLIKRFVEENESNYAPFNSSWLSPYSWSHESIKVNRLDVAKNYLNKPLSLISLERGKYSLYHDDKLLLNGVVGKLESTSDGLLEINIQELNAGEGKAFIIKKLSKYQAIVTLQKKLNVSEQGKKTGIINLALEGENKEQILNILDNVSNSYLLQNKSRSSEEASNALNFLNEQIKPVKERSEAAEAALKEYRTNNRTADMSMETQTILKVVADIDTQLQQLSLRRDQLNLKYTSNHPTLTSLASQETKLNKRRNETLSKITELPETQQQLLKLEGDYKVANTIYVDLLNKIQEFKIAKASNVGNVYILDTAAVNETPVKPKKTMIMALGLLLGFFVGILIVFLKKALYHKVNNPEKIEEQIGLPVYATIPLSKGVKLTGGLKKKKQKQKTLLAIEDNNDPAIESLRSLRTSLHFALLEAKNNIVMITGPSPGIGKSFISSNLAAVISGSDQRVLLIDADMRKGYLHNLVNTPISPGLSDLISEKSTIEDAIHTYECNGNSFDVLTRGQTPPNPSELLMHQNFEKLLTELSGNYDLILIDTPPIHAVTDPTIVGRLSGVVFMVVRQDMHAMKEIEHAVKRLSNTGIETKGFIFNGYDAKKNRNAYGYQSYYGEYQSD